MSRDFVVLTFAILSLKKKREKDVRFSWQRHKILVEIDLVYKKTSFDTNEFQLTMII